MPGLDRSGPAGAGPMTGGRRGVCGTSTPQAGTVDYGYGRGGRGWGCRRGFGQGRGRGFGATGFAGNPISTADEKQILQTEADALKASLESIQKRLESLENGGAE